MQVFLLLSHKISADPSAGSAGRLHGHLLSAHDEWQVAPMLLFLVAGARRGPGEKFHLLTDQPPFKRFLSNSQAKFCKYMSLGTAG